MKLNQDKILFFFKVETFQSFNSYEAIKGSEEKQLKYFLDFDAYAGNITTDEILNVTDKLHDIIHDEWENNTIKQPVKDWMDEEREE